MAMDHTFHVADYVVFGATIFISLAVGVYFALSGGRQKTMSEFLVGGRAMKFIPVAVSLMVSFESSIMMLGTPAEVYVYGAQIFISLFGFMASFLLCRQLMIPLIHPLRITSAYEYLERRFKSRALRNIGTCLGVLTYVFYMGIVLYGPALALEAVTGFPQLGSIFSVAAAAIVYTSLGGLKAVIWTDVFQAVIMLAGMMAIFIKGTIDTGGVAKVWTIAREGGRLNFFNFDPDPRVRHTFWGLFFGTFIRSLGLVFNQSTIQRVCSTATLADAKRVMLVVSPAFCITITLAIIEGIVAYSYYVNAMCDPLASDQISNPNQIIPYMVMDMFRYLPGMPGLFLAALFSASLSTISSGLSSLSLLTWEDMLKPHLTNISDFKATIIAKVSVLVFGLLSCGIAIVISFIGGTLMQISNTILSSFNGPLCGLFIIASLCPWANAKGAMAGTVVSTVFMVWLCGGSAFSRSAKPTPWLPLAPTDMCSALDNATLQNTSQILPNTSQILPNTSQILASIRMTTEFSTPMEDDQVTGVDVMYSLSYTWLSTVGTLVTVIVSFFVSWATGFNREEKVDPQYVIFIWDRILSALPHRVQERFGYKSNEHKLNVELTRRESPFYTTIIITPGTTRGTDVPLLHGHGTD